MALIFLPGASGNTEFWQPVMSLLSEQHQKTVIAYPEFGGYSPYSGVDSFTDLQNYVLDQLDHDAVIIAQSMGGIFAVQAALQKTNQVKALVLVATSGGIDLTPFNVADWRYDYQLSFDVPDWFVSHVSCVDDQLYKINCPVLLIWGDKDPISPVAVGQYLNQKIIFSELYIVENGQHDLANVHAELVAQRISEFLEKIRT